MYIIWDRLAGFGLIGPVLCRRNYIHHGKLRIACKETKRGNLVIQLFAILLAIVCIPVLLKIKIPVGPALLILGVLAGVVGRLSPTAIGTAFTDIFTNDVNFTSVLVVIEIGMLSSLMSHYGILKRAEDALRKLVPSGRVIIMLMPAMVGALQVPGGAALSAPFVNTLGTEMGLNKAQRANVNVVSRHVLLFLVPFSTNMLIVHSLAPDVSIFYLAMLNLGFVILMQVAGYFFLLRKSTPVEIPKCTGKERINAFGEFLLTLSPIYLVIVLNIVFNMPYTITLIFSVMAVFLMSNKENFPRRFISSFNSNTATMIVGIYFFQNIVGSSSELLELFESLIKGQSQWVFLGMVALVGIIFGTSTGLMYLSMGVLIPIAMSLPYATEAARLIALSYTFCWCFIGYYFSPIHLCQLLTDQEVGCSVGERYRSYLPMMLVLPVCTVVLYFVYTMIFV